MDDRTCPFCGEAVTRLAGPGRTPTYCSASCRRRHWATTETGKASVNRMRSRANAKLRARNASRPDRFKECPECGESFVAGRIDQVCCSKRCKWRRDHRRRAQQSPDELRAEKARDRQRRASYYAAQRKAWREKPENRAAELERFARRRAKQRHASERFTPQEIFERDGWQCHLCGRKVPEDLTYPHPMSASLDHLVPLSLDGGEHTRANAACAHLRCNLSKGARPMGEQLRLIG